MWMNARKGRTAAATTATTTLEDTLALVVLAFSSILTAAPVMVCDDFSLLHKSELNTGMSTVNEYRGGD